MPAAPQRSAVRTLSLWAPLLVLAGSLRLLTFSMLSRTGVPLEVDDLIRQNAPQPLALLLLTALCGAWARHHYPRMPSMLLTGLALLAFGGGVALVHAIAPWWLGEWLSTAAFAFVRWDLLGLTLAALTSFHLLSSLRNRGWQVASGLLTLVVALLTALFACEFVYLLNIGAPGGWPVLRYGVAHLPQLLPLLASSLSSQQLAFAALFTALLLSPWVIKRLPGPQRWLQLPGSSAPITPRTAWSAALPLLLVLALAPSRTLEMDQQHGLLVDLIQEAVASPAGAGARTEGDVLNPAEIAAANQRALRFTATDASQLRNLVIIVLESARSRSITPYNHALTTTPFLGSLADRGALVESMFTVIPHTNKSLVALLAGVFPSPSREMVEANPGRLPAPGLPNLLRPFGYASAFFTPATLKYENKGKLLRNLGFDHVVGDGDLPTEGFARKAYFGHEDRIVLQPSMHWVDQQVAAGKPFFVNYLTLSAHHPYDVPGGSFLHRHNKAGPPRLDDYHDALHYTDSFIRDLFQEFERRGLVEKTVFVIVGDHGEAFGEHGQFTHGDVPWDEALQVPAILFAPGLLLPGSRIEGPRQHIDLLPTIADLLKLRIEGAVPAGRSMLKPVDPARELFHSAWNGRLALVLRRPPLKFIYHWGRRPTQAFNLETDPGEQRDIAPQLPPDQILDAETALLRWFHRTQKGYDE